MATYSEIHAKHATLSGTTADSVTITNKYPYLEIINRDTETALYVSAVPDGTPTTAVSAADDTLYVPPSGSKVIRRPAGGAISVVGSANPYSVEGFDL